MKKMKILKLTLGLLALLALEANLTKASAQITWGTPGVITGDSDASTSGTEVDGIRAYNIDFNATGSFTVFGNITLNNGVVFNMPTISAGTGAPMADASGDIVMPTSNMTSTAYPYAPNPGSTDANYNELLESISFGGSSYTTPNYTNSIIFNNLTEGDTYQVEVWTNYAGQGVNLAGTTPVGLAASVSGGNGSYDIGTFTATGTSFTEDYENGTGYPGEGNDLNGVAPSYYFGILNAVQLRDLGTTDVPEPRASALLLLGMSCLGWLIYRRRTSVVS